MSDDTLLRVDELTTGYGRVSVLRGVTLSAARGEIVAVLGRNGAGKTTLMRALAGVIPVWEGWVKLDGKDITKFASEDRAVAGVALCPEGRQVFASLSVERNLLIGATSLRYRLGRREARRARRADLDRVYSVFPVLWERRGSLAGQLSGGQQQMLAIARALMARPRVLLIDEPSLGLAPMVINTIYSTLETVVEAGQAVVLVEESPERALTLARRAYVLRNGKVCLEGSASAVRGSAELQSAYLSPASPTPPP